MYLDDLHFADDASIGVINQLFFTLKSTERIFFIASSRECGALWKMISNLNYFCVPHIQLKLDCMDERAINKTISELLHLSPRITGPLSSIAHHKTQGNALFFSRWMMELSKEGLLRPSLSRRRWEWDEEKIRLRKVPDDVGLFFRDSIHKLSTDVQKSLFIVASFGASLDGALIQPIERALSMQLLIPLNVAVSEGLLDKVGGQFRFSHDCIQEAAYDMMAKEKKYLHHFQLGLCLANDALAEDNDNILFIAVNQLNLGGPKSVEAKGLSFTVADMNLKAGKKCMQMSDFKAAYSFFDHGISFLRKKHWQEHYALSIELFTLAAKCALPNGEFTALNILSEQVLKFARTDDEKLPVMYYSILRLEFSSQFAEAAQIIMKVLLKLGVALPESSTSADTLSLVAQTKNKLETYSIHELKGLKRMEDQGKKMAMLFLARLYHCFFMINPEKKPIVIMKMVLITLSHGICQTSPLSFVWFGSLLGALGDIEAGHRYTKLAKQLIEENASYEYESSGAVIGWATQVMCYVEPVQAAVGNFIEGIARSMSSGDTNSAFMNMAFYINEGYCSSLYLPILKTKSIEFHQVMKQHNHVNLLSHLIIMERHLQLLMGASWGTDRGFEEEIDVRHPHAVLYAAIYSLMASFIFRRFAPLKDALQQILARGPPSQGTSLMFGDSEWKYIIGLASYWISRESEEPHWAEMGGNTAKGAVGGWSKISRWNFEHKLFLLEAEEHFCNRNYEQARNCYEKAIDSAATKKFVKDEALACELAGYFYLEMDEKVTALDYLVKAHERYEMWGATGKATKLHEEIMTKLS
jgi:predicted ATPase